MTESKKTINLDVTGSGNSINAHLLLPSGINRVQNVIVNGIPVKFTNPAIENSQYVDFDISLPVIQHIIIQYS